MTSLPSVLRSRTASHWYAFGLASIALSALPVVAACWPNEASPAQQPAPNGYSYDQYYNPYSDSSPETAGVYYAHTPPTQTNYDTGSYAPPANHQPAGTPVDSPLPQEYDPIDLQLLYSQTGTNTMRPTWYGGQPETATVFMENYHSPADFPPTDTDHPFNAFYLSKPHGVIITIQHQGQNPITLSPDQQTAQVVLWPGDRLLISAQGPVNGPVSLRSWDGRTTADLQTNFISLTPDQLEDTSFRQTWLYNQPIGFGVRIKPEFAYTVRQAELVYIYDRRTLHPLSGPKVTRTTVRQPLRRCTPEIFCGSISPEHTRKGRESSTRGDKIIVNGKFWYQFVVTLQDGSVVETPLTKGQLQG